MAIVTCPDCRHELSDSAISCPNCGYPYGKNYKLYLRAKQLMSDAKSAEAILGIAEIFSDIRGFRDSEELMETCRAKLNEVPKKACYVTPKPVEKEDNIPSSLYAILLTILGMVILCTSFADGYFNWSYSNSNLSGGKRYYTNGSLMLLGGDLDLVILVIFVCLAICVLLAWVAAVKNKRLELYCVITSSAVLGLILICSVAAPVSFTEHDDFGFGFYSHMDFESFGHIYYIQLLAAIGLLAVSILNKIKSPKK